jgi:hypothetical protein
LRLVKLREIEALKHGYAHKGFESEEPVAWVCENGVGIDEFDSSVEIPVRRLHIMNHQLHKASDGS